MQFKKYAKQTPSAAPAGLNEANPNRRTVRACPPPRRRQAIALALCLCAGAAAAQTATPTASQTATPTVTPEQNGAPTRDTAPAAEAARDALKKKEGDVDQATLLKETLSATDKQYSLIKRGQRAVIYDLTYTYIGVQDIDANFSDGRLTLFEIQNRRSHAVTNTVSADYGVLNNLTANITVPLVAKYAESATFSEFAGAFGDVSLGIRYQPFARKRPDEATITAVSTLRLPTGRSPFKTIDGQGLATGAGYSSLNVGVNASKVVDPVAVFGSAGYTFSYRATGLEQKLDGKDKDSFVVLNEVRPGQGFNFGVGFAFALSYHVSTTLSFQESVQASSKLYVTTAQGERQVRRTGMQTSAMLNIGLGWRMSPKTTVNITCGVGLTSDTPDFTLGLNMPLHL